MSKGDACSTSRSILIRGKICGTHSIFRESPRFVPHTPGMKLAVLRWIGFGLLLLDVDTLAHGALRRA